MAQWTTEQIGQARRLARTMTIKQIHENMDTGVSVKSLHGRLKMYGIIPVRNSAHHGTSKLSLPPEELEALNEELSHDHT